MIDEIVAKWFAEAGDVPFKVAEVRAIMTFALNESGNQLLQKESQLKAALNDLQATQTMLANERKRWLPRVVGR